MTEDHRPCTCGSPPSVVDLTDAFFAQSSLQEDTAKTDTTAAELRLQQNLSRYGWSHVRIFRNKTSSLSGSLLQQTPSQWKQRLVSLFQAKDVIRSTPGVTYRQAESGAPGTVEPKESLEVQRQRRKDEHQHGIYGELLDFTNVLHQVACAVRSALHLPAGVLLDEDEEEEEEEAATNGPSSVLAPLDLMRVFYYDTVDTTAAAATAKLSSSDSPQPPVLGSSEHTDWGTFTVVWQDDVGGLQTYCHACQKFHHVTTAPGQDEGAWDFVVHVGDLTSLCVGLTLVEKQETDIRGDDDNDDSSSTVVWPSPKHRVISPTQQRRLSLVYFAYPPPSASLKSMQQDLVGWCQETLLPDMKSTVRVPWEDYYILRDQSNHGQGDDPRAMYEKLFTLPVDAILQKKWSQVQR